MAHAASSDDLRASSLFDFSSHIALVSGGATGLGEMAAQAFVQNGSRVIIASRKESELKSTTARLNALGPGTCEYVVADLKDKAGCDALCAEVARRVDRLTVLVNNTGATWGADYYDFPESGWDKLMALNVKSIFYMTVGLEPLLLKGATPDTPSRVINIASMAGIQTVDVTTGEGGGLSPPGTGTYSCGCFASLLAFKANIGLHRWSLKSCMHPPHQASSLQTCSQEHHGQCHLPRRVPFAHDKFWT